MCSLAAYRIRIPRPLVWIVDAHRSDYNHLLADVRAEQLEIHILASGRKLLQNWSVEVPDVCIVHLQLQKLCGFDLIEMIQPFPEGMTVCSLADKYQLEDEIRALSLGVHSYLCKPLEAALFFEFCLCPSGKEQGDRVSGRTALSLKDELDDPVDPDLKWLERRMLT